MERLRVPPLVGIVGCLAFLAVLAVPYGLLGTTQGSGAAAYYGAGAVNPLIAGLFSLLAVIVLAAGRDERTDPILAAGVSLVLGLFVVVLAGLWAVTVPSDLVLGLSTNTLIEHHRWTLPVVGAVVPVAVTWWARTLGVL